MLILFLRSPRMRLPLLIFTLSLVPPVLALHGKLPWTPYAERYLYLSMTGFALVVGFAVSKLPNKSYLIAFALVVLLSVPTIQRVNLWGNPLEFWREVMLQSPEFPRSYVGVACELVKEKKYDEAEPLLNKALKMGENKEFVWQNMAMVRLGKGDLPGYESAMLKSAELSGNATPKYISLIQTVSKKSQDKASLRRIISYYLLAHSEIRIILMASIMRQKSIFNWAKRKTPWYFSGNLWTPLVIPCINHSLSALSKSWIAATGSTSVTNTTKEASIGTP